ncbi:MAG: SDR family oxidoreductase [Planctomycetota bacterium]
MAEIIPFGASGGIGQYLVKKLASEHKIVGTYNRSDPSRLDPGAMYYRVDVTEAAAVEDFVKTIGAGLKNPVLIYTPGISPNALAHKFAEPDWDQALAINLTGAMRAVRAMLPFMRSLQWGRIIFLSSVLARQGIPGTIAYSVTKAALAAMGRVLSVENATKRITANTLALGYFSVGIIETVPEPYLKEHVPPRIPQGRLGDPASIAAAVRFIIEADYLTGATIDVNGGMLGA